jgi:hypothetical protein
MNQTKNATKQVWESSTNRRWPSDGKNDPLLTTYAEAIVNDCLSFLVPMAHASEETNIAICMARLAIKSHFGISSK